VLAVVAAGELLEACSSTPQAGTFAPPAAPAASELAASGLTVKPKSLELAAIGSSGSRNAVVSERGYYGKFVQKSGCRRTATATPASGKGPRFSFTITPLSVGNCAIVFLDEKKHQAKLSVSVLQGPYWPNPSSSPSAIPSTQPSGSPKPSPSASPAAIFVTYSGAGIPNVVAYDEQGSTQKTGSWSGSGLNPSTIRWAPVLSRFYLIADKVDSSSAQNFVEAFSPNGDRLPHAFSPSQVSNARAIAVGQGTLYVVDTTRRTIVAFDRNGAQLGGVTFPVGIATAHGGLAFDTNLNRLYVANTTSGKIEAYSTTGTLLPYTRSFPPPASCVGGCTPEAVTFDPDNNELYVAWSGFGGGIFAYAESGTRVTIAGSFAGLTSPQDIAVDTHNRFLYVTDGIGVKTFDESGNRQTLSAQAFLPSFAVTSVNGIAVKPP
jgi:hypothetical protein